MTAAASPHPRPLLIPVILGTLRKGRASENVARFVTEHFAAMPGVETRLVDVRELMSSVTDEGEGAKIPAFSELCMIADAFVLVVPEYNHGYPASLKYVLDTNLKEYIHKPVGICGVSAGPWGGVRAIQSLLPVMRELGLVTIFWDGNFSTVQKLFDADGKIQDRETHTRRIDKFAKELVWMAKVLRHGRETISIE
jgi:NAD(P)H-dependent FMN reductase